MGGTMDFKWRGWSNGGKNQNAKKIPMVSNTDPQKSLDQNLTPPPPPSQEKKSHANFPSLLDSNNTRNTKNMIFCFINNIYYAGWQLQIVLNPQKIPS